MFKKENEIKKKVLEGLDISCKKLVQSKKERNSDVIVSENGKIIHIKPSEIECD